MTPEQAVEAIISYCWTVSDDLKVDTNVIHNPEKILEIIHAQRAEAEAMQWQPIETAPDIGVYLVWNGDEAALSYETYRHWEMVAFEATHWMPLPPAPQEGER